MSDPGSSYPAGPGGYGPPRQENNTPLVLGIVGIVCWFFCALASIILGLIGQSKARELGQSDTVPKVAWIGGIVSMVIGLLVGLARAGTMMN